MNGRVPIRALPSGVPGFDDVLGGGIPEFSLTLIVGGPGCGKTTLGHQLMFANATRERKALFFSIIGEPPIKVLRYQQQFSFFDPTKIDESIRFIHLGQDAEDGGLAKVLERITHEVDESNPGIVVVDSFRSMMRQTLQTPTGEMALQDFMQRLALHLTSCQATTFLLGEYSDNEYDSSVFTVADGIVWLQQAVDRNSVVRKLRVQKMRGQAQIPGLHTMRINDDGLRIFPRILKPEQAIESHRPVDERVTTGVTALDEMTGGGIPRGYAVLVAGPSGSGKTILANQFILAGAERGEPGVIAVFEKRPNDYTATSAHGDVLDGLVAEKKVEILYLRPLDLSIDETLTALREAVVRIGAKRAVIDSLSGLELALAPTFREDFRESLYRMVGALTGMGVTVMSTVEMPDSYTSLQFSPHGIAFLNDAIIIQRYLEIDGALSRALSVVKVRGSAHSKELRQYAISPNGEIAIGKALKGYQGLLTGSPTSTENQDAAGRPLSRDT
ncbi:MAG TPA: ATPase domain-containing protein [Polyangiaceae bacterium]